MAQGLSQARGPLVRVRQEGRRVHAPSLADSPQLKS